MKKTIREWLGQLGPPYREQALKNAEIQNVDFSHEVETLYKAIGYAFVFKDTPEGWGYWFSLRESSKNNVEEVLQGCIYEVY